MTDEKTTTPDTKPEAPARRPRADQNQGIADAVTVARQVLETVKEDTELASLMAARGYDAAKLSEGFALQEAAQSAFSARQQAMGAQKAAGATRDDAATKARLAYRDFRDTARSIFKDDAVRAALGVGTRVPVDPQKFATTAVSSYKSALDTPDYLAELGKYGFGKPVIESAMKSLEELIAADNAHETAMAEAVRSTKRRDEAKEALEAWIRQFRGIAKVATRSRPELAKKLGI